MCGGEMFEEDNYEVNNYGYCCESCRSAHCTLCEDCNIFARISESFDIDHGDRSVCDGCWDSYYYYCDNCETGHSHDYTCQDDSVIKQYDWEPDSFAIHTRQKLGTEPTYGFELEIDDGNNHTELAEELDFKYEGFLYYKYDGSLNNGFEIISHPFTYSYYKDKIIGNNYLDTMFSKCKYYGFTSYNAGTCGIHVHIGMKHFTDTQLYKFQKFYYTNPSLMNYISRRDEEAMDQWCNLSGTSSEALVRRTKEKRSRKYLGIHLNWKGTVEIRIFRGTLVRKSFLRNIEFAMASYEFSREVGMRDTTTNTFIKWLDDDMKYPNLRSHMRRF
tara:strand:+ start:1 stop:990 length:990 start_codon:yes stop_codon:yes gene_type:complete